MIVPAHIKSYHSEKKHRLSREWKLVINVAEPPLYRLKLVTDPARIAGDKIIFYDITVNRVKFISMGDNALLIGLLSFCN